MAARACSSSPFGDTSWPIFVTASSSCVHRAFGIVLMRLRIPKESQDFVRRHGGNRSAHSGDCFGGRVLEILGNLDQVFGVAS